MISQRQDASHYVPVLRFKRAERVALRNLEESDKDSMTPLIEILPNGDARYEASGGSTIAAQVKENWGDRIHRLLSTIFAWSCRTGNLAFRSRPSVWSDNHSRNWPRTI
jgi:hypothetical protein